MNLHGAIKYAMMSGRATSYLSDGHTMVWALPFSWYVPGWMPVPQGVHPSTYENGRPDQRITGRAHTNVALEVLKIYVSALIDLGARLTEPRQDTKTHGRTGIIGKLYDQLSRHWRGENCGAGL